MVIHNLFFGACQIFIDCYYRINFLSLKLVYIPNCATEIAFKDIFTYLLGGSIEANLHLLAEL